MGIDFHHTIEIERPAAEVFSFIADCENNPRWQKGMTSCRWTSAEPMVVGATIAQEARFLGQRIDTLFEVTEFVAGERISIESTKSTIPIQVTRAVESLGARRCRVTAHVRGQPTGLFKLFGRMVERSVAKDYRGLKQLLEAR